MKKHLLRVAVITAMAAAGSYAQSYQSLRAEIPFDFVVGKATLPAGQYMVDAPSNLPVVTIGSARGEARTMILGITATSATIQEAGKLVFHCYEGRCFLSQVWTPGNDSGRELPKTAQERELSAYRAIPPVETYVALR